MATFGLQRNPAAARPHQPRHPQAGAGTNQTDGRFRYGGSAADRPAFVRPQQGQRPRQCGEVVENQQLVQSQRLLRGFSGKGPVIVSQINPVAGDRRSDRNGGAARTQAGRVAQIGGGGLNQIGIIHATQDPFGADALIGVYQGKTGVGAANISD